MSLIYADETYEVIVNPRTDKAHLARVIVKDRPCSHESPIGFVMECGGFVDPSEVLHGDDTAGNVITCMKCRKKARDDALKWLKRDRQWAQDDFERTVARIDRVDTFIRSALGGRSA